MKWLARFSLIACEWVSFRLGANLSALLLEIDPLLHLETALPTRRPTTRSARRLNSISFMLV